MKRLDKVDNFKRTQIDYVLTMNERNIPSMFDIPHDLAYEFLEVVEKFFNLVDIKDKPYLINNVRSLMENYIEFLVK